MSRRTQNALITLALCLAAAGCGSIAPTNPDPGARANAVSPAHAPAVPASLAVPITLASKGQVIDPDGGDETYTVLVQDPSTSVVGGLLQYVVNLVRLVFPGVDTLLGTGRWSLDFHPGSLSQIKAVSIALPTDGSLSVKFGPEGTVFGTDVDVAVRYDGTVLDPGAPGYVPGLRPVFLYYDPALKGWTEMPSTVDPAHRTLHAKLHHFSVYAVGGKAGW